MLQNGLNQARLRRVVSQRFAPKKSWAKAPAFSESNHAQEKIFRYADFLNSEKCPVTQLVSIS